MQPWLWSVFWLAVGLAVGALASGWVLSRRLRAQAKRERAAERRASAAERVAEAESMTRGLAHEIKNPLSTIGLNVELLAEAIADLDAPDEDRDRLVRRTGTLVREVDRLRGILQDFLDFAGEKKIAPADADLNDLVGELVDFFSAQAERQGVRLRTEYASGPLRASLDAGLVKQAVLNLLINAVQAMAPGPGDPSRSGEGGPNELMLRTLRAADDDGEAVVCLHVIDTGPGMAEDVRARLFTPYFTTKAGGSGLGLPTTRRIVEAHGGRIDVFSEPGRGTDFALTFPVAGPPGAG